MTKEKEKRNKEPLSYIKIIINSNIEIDEKQRL